MLTVKTNMYTEVEKKALDVALRAAMNKFIDKYCGTKPCHECEYRHVCYDLESARRYINKIATEGMKQ